MTRDYGHGKRLKSQRASVGKTVSIALMIRPDFCGGLPWKVARIATGRFLPLCFTISEGTSVTFVG